MKRLYIAIISIIAIIGLGVIFAGPVMSSVENPKYKVISKDGDIEIRKYESMLIAEVEVAGERKEAINQGFKLLADYIFGNNLVKSKIAMTAPVEQQSAKIAMTAPVEQSAGVGGVWKVNFIMPAEYNLDNLPKPVNDMVRIVEIPAKQYIVIKFSGTNTDANVLKHEEKLREYISNNSLTTRGSAKYAFYNPPWTLPIMRRNEVMLELVKEQ